MNRFCTICKFVSFIVEIVVFVVYILIVSEKDSLNKALEKAIGGKSISFLERWRYGDVDSKTRDFAISYRRRNGLSEAECHIINGKDIQAISDVEKLKKAKVVFLLGIDDGPSFAAFLLDLYESGSCKIVCTSSVRLSGSPLVATEFSGRVIPTLVLDQAETNPGEAPLILRHLYGSSMAGLGELVTEDKADALLRALARDVFLPRSNSALIGETGRAGTFIHRSAIGPMMEALLSRMVIVECRRFDERRGTEVTTNSLHFFADTGFMSHWMNKGERKNDKLVWNRFLVRLYSISESQNFIACKSGMSLFTAFVGGERLFISLLWWFKDRIGEGEAARRMSSIRSSCRKVIVSRESAYRKTIDGVEVIPLGDFMEGGLL
jgi:hypothetical protein